jgi:hypothetical protein
MNIRMHVPKIVHNQQIVSINLLSLLGNYREVNEHKIFFCIKNSKKHLLCSKLHFTKCHEKKFIEKFNFWLAIPTCYVKNINV